MFKGADKIIPLPSNALSLNDRLPVLTVKGSPRFPVTKEELKKSWQTILSQDPKNAKVVGFSASPAVVGGGGGGYGTAPDLSDVEIDTIMTTSGLTSMGLTTADLSPADKKLLTNRSHQQISSRRYVKI